MAAESVKLTGVQRGYLEACESLTTMSLTVDDHPDLRYLEWAGLLNVGRCSVSGKLTMSITDAGREVLRGS